MIVVHFHPPMNGLDDVGNVCSYVRMSHCWSLTGTAARFFYMASVAVGQNRYEHIPFTVLASGFTGRLYECMYRGSSLYPVSSTPVDIYVFTSMITPMYVCTYVCMCM